MVTRPASSLAQDRESSPASYEKQQPTFIDVSKKIQGRPRMLTRDLFAVANVVIAAMDVDETAHAQNE